MAAGSGRSYWGSKIVAVGKNYAKHKIEMGGVAERDAFPLIFLKPNSSVIHPGSAIRRPPRCTELHHEVELGVVIGKRASSIAKADWMEYVGGYVLALDLTSRNEQAEAKEKGWPWAWSKGQDTFCPMSLELTTEQIPDPHNVELHCSVDGKERQRGNTGDMLFRIDELMEYISAGMTLEPGDVILTGTPHGVGPVEPGQKITAGITGITEMTFDVTE